MTAKQIIFRENAHSKIMAGVRILADAVRGTLGPKARTVVPEKSFGAPVVPEKVAAAGSPMSEMGM